MLTITQAAGDFLLGILQNDECPAGVAVRLLLDGQGIAMKLDQEADGDTSMAHKGRTVLLLSEEVVTSLAQSKLDIDPEDSSLMLVRADPPN